MKSVAQLEYGDVSSRCMILDELHFNSQIGTVVYSAADQVSGNLVVLKYSDLSNKGGQSKFVSEITSLVLLEGEDGFPKYLRSGRKDNINHLVTSYDGDLNLVDLAKSREDYSSPDLETDLRIAHQLTKRCEVMHGYGILNRDIKPANVIISDEGKVTLIDFNVSVFGKRSHKAKGTFCFPVNSGSVMGSPGYFSSELIGVSGLPGYSEYSDVRSLGITIHTLMSGTGESPFWHLSHVLRGDRLPQLHKTRAPITERVSEVLDWSTDPNWEERPKARQFRKEGLEPLMESMGIDWEELPDLKAA
jgi:serine/threonine protein kinase